MAMEISKSFVVRASPEAAWAFLTDPVRVARCLPGAAITSQIDERTHAGTITVKVGPVAATYKGTMRFERLDAVTRTAEIAAAGQDVRGKGGADMRMTSSLVERAPGETEVQITSQVNVMGILAQFGRGMIQDVSDQMFATFVEAARTELERPDHPAQAGLPAAAPRAAAAGRSPGEGGKVGPGGQAVPESPGVPSDSGRDGQAGGAPPIEVLSFGSAVVGRATARAAQRPALWIGVAAVLVVLYLWLGR